MLVVWYLDVRVIARERERSSLVFRFASFRRFRVVFFCVVYCVC